MGWYEDRVLPRMIDLVMDTGPMRKLRVKTAEPLAGTVLEIGFGTGLNLPHYPAAVTQVLAVDPAMLGRTLAAERLKAVSFDVDFVGLDGQAVELPDASVDAALCTWTLCTIPDADRALKEVQRILKPGGALRFVEHGRHPQDGVARWQDRFNPVQKFFAGGCNLNRRIDALIRDSGFELEELETFGMPGPKVMTWTYLGTARRQD
ncbi:MAG: class I SAM-dependent methyltransferase [Deltaproteobacteria bacterium]|nr:class I SAM-dependent methyltransferase [Deltaproteobacteria bacterium]